MSCIICDHGFSLPLYCIKFISPSDDDDPSESAAEHEHAGMSLVPMITKNFTVTLIARLNGSGKLLALA